MKTRIQSLATITLIFVAFAVLPKTQAVVPPPDGGYPGGNTAEGQDALLSLTTGTLNTAVGFFALENNDLGNYNTAIGAGALFATDESVMTLLWAPERSSTPTALATPPMELLHSLIIDLAPRIPR
jgi:hypothetical protein